MKNVATKGIVECQQYFPLAVTLASKSQGPSADLEWVEGLDLVKSVELLSTKVYIDRATGRLKENIRIGQDIERLGSYGGFIGGDGNDKDGGYGDEPRFNESDDE